MFSFALVTSVQSQMEVFRVYSEKRFLKNVEGNDRGPL